MLLRTLQWVSMTTPVDRILLLVGPQLLKHRKIFERCYIAGDRAAGRNLAQQTAHNLAGSGFWQHIGETYLIRSCRARRFL